MKRTSDFNMEKFASDNLHAIDAKFEAQKIAFAPLTFQALRALIELNILKIINDSGDDGLTIDEISEKSGISKYGVGVLTEMAVGMNVLLLKLVDGKERLSLSKIGWFLLEDNLTKVNFNFTNDICYKGAFNLIDSIKTGKPEGLKVFGEQWATVYEALSTLPERERKVGLTLTTFTATSLFLKHCQLSTKTNLNDFLILEEILQNGQLQAANLTRT